MGSFCVAGVNGLLNTFPPLAVALSEEDFNICCCGTISVFGGAFSSVDFDRGGGASFTDKARRATSGVTSGCLALSSTNGLNLRSDQKIPKCRSDSDIL